MGPGHPEMSLVCKRGLRIFPWEIDSGSSLVSGVGCTADDRHILYTVKFDCIGDIKFPRSKHSITGQMRVSQQAFKALCYYVE